MTRWATHGRGDWKHNLLLALTMGTAVILMGCGGGGGGNGGPGPGGTPGVCGSAAGSTTTVVCGYVKDDVSGAPVQNAAVVLLNSAGSPVSGQVLTNASGFYIFATVPAGVTQFRVDPPTSPAYEQQTVRYNGLVYAYYLQNRTNTSACVPPTGTLIAGDNKLANSTVFPGTSPPPFPNGCF